VIEDSVKEVFDFLSKFRTSPYTGLLVTGKPGNGKTFICRHFAEI
jgi:SpoVK/Ycf46/Vps4 family AAA+-type ATPase